MKSKELGFKIKSFEPNDEQGVFIGLANKRWFKDHAKEVTTDTAFTKTIEQHKAEGTLPKLLLQHDYKQVIGVILDMWEDQDGLWIKGKLCLETTLGKETYALMKMDALCDLSIGYTVIAKTDDHKTKTRYLTEVSIHEVSVVTFPCNKQSNITSVKQDSLEEVVTPIEEANTVAIEEEQPIQEDASIEETIEIANAEVEQECSKEPVEVADALLETKLTNFLLSVKLNSFLKNK